MPKKKAVNLSDLEVRALAEWCSTHGYGFLMKEPYYIRIEGQ